MRRRGIGLGARHARRGRGPAVGERAGGCGARALRIEAAAGGAHRPPGRARGRGARAPRRRRGRGARTAAGDAPAVAALGRSAGGVVVIGRLASCAADTATVLRATGCERANALADTTVAARALANWLTVRRSPSGMRPALSQP